MESYETLKAEPQADERTLGDPATGLLFTRAGTRPHG